MVVVDSLINEARIGKQLVVFHCHHYNVFLQRTLDDAIGEKAAAIQINAARKVVEKMYENEEKSFQFASDLFKELGFGLIDFSAITNEGGKVECPVSHYAFGWFEKFGPSGKGICYFAAGYILATINSVYGLNLTSDHIREVACRGIDPEKYQSCIFEVNV